MAGSVKSVNQASPPVLKPGQPRRLMVRMADMAVMKTGSWISGEASSQAG
jgi:hypothetical protein